MKAPTKCPVCGDPMLNVFPPAEELSDRVHKHCDKRLNHAIVITCNGNEVEALTIELNKNTQLEAVWYFYVKELWITDKDKPVITLPWFEPNLSDYKKLVNKIKTYLVFS